MPGVDGTPGAEPEYPNRAESRGDLHRGVRGARQLPAGEEAHRSGPGTGRIGDKVFDDFAKTQVQFLAGAGARRR